MKVSNHVSTYLVQNHIITEEYKDIVSYGMEHMVITLGNIVIFLEIGAFLHMFWETVVFLLVFASVRRYAGGYHAPTRWRCFIYSITIVVTSLFLIKYVYINRVFYVISSWIVGSVIISISPVQADNKPLNVYEVCAYRKKAVFLSVMWIVLLGALTGLKQDIFAHTIWVALVWVAVLMVVGKVTKYFKKNGGN